MSSDNAQGRPAMEIWVQDAEVARPGKSQGEGHKMVMLVLGLSILLLCCSCAVRRPNEPGLVAHYTFHEGSGTILHNACAAGNDGEIIGAAWVKSEKGAALDFDGKGDSVDCGDEPSGRVAGPLTVSVWVRRTSNTQQYIVNRGGWNIYLLPDGRPVFETRNAANDAWDSLGANTRVPLNKWAFVAAVYDIKRQCMEVFVNGELSSRKPRTDGEIGGLYRSKLILGSKLNGLMANFRLYGRALGAQEILQLYETTAPHPSLASPQYRLRLKPHLFFSSRKVKADLYLSKSAEQTGKVSAEAGLFRAGEQEPAQHKTIGALSAAGKSEVTFSLDGLPPGDYEIRASAKTPDGQTFAKISKPVTLPEKPWWYDSEAGIGDDVLAPWTPLKSHIRHLGPAGANAELLVSSLDVECWGRTYRFGRTAFPREIVTAGRSILAAPIRFVGRVDGHNLEWPDVRCRVKKRSPAKLLFCQEETTGPVELTADTLIEYDGLIRIDCKLKPRRAVRLEKLALEIPLRQEYAKLVYYYRDARFMAPGAIPEEGIARDFNPAIWIGDEERGLQWFTDSDRDWHPADPNRAVEIVPDGQNVVLRLNLIGAPIKLKPNAARTLDTAPGLFYTFGLQATPVKPITKDAWDYHIASAHRYGADYAMLTEEIAGKPVLDHYAGLGVRTLLLLNWTDVLSYPAPVGHADDLRLIVKACHKRGMKVICYLGAQYSERAPEFATFFDEFVNWGSSRPYSHYGYVDNYPPMPAQMTYGPCIRSHWKDMMIAGAARLMDEFDVDGLYLDGVGIAGACHNVHHGCGFVDTDGKLHPTWTVFDGRDFIKRLYRVVKSRKPYGQIDVHPSAHWMSPVMAWATNAWDGETILGEDRKGANPKKGVFLLEYLTPDMFRAQFMGRNWGVPTEFVDYYVPYPYERQFALTLLHDVPIRAHISPEKLKFQSALWGVMDAFGRKEAEWLPYWRNSDFVKVTPQGSDDKPGAFVTLYRHDKNGALVVVSNLAPDKQDVTVQLNLPRLGLGGSRVTAKDALKHGTVPMESGRITFSGMQSVSWRLIWIRP